MGDIFDGKEDQLRSQIGMDSPGIQQHGAVSDPWEVLLYLESFKLGILFKNICREDGGAPANPIGHFQWSNRSSPSVSSGVTLNVV